MKNKAGVFDGSRLVFFRLTIALWAGIIKGKTGVLEKAEGVLS